MTARRMMRGWMSRSWGRAASETVSIRSDPALVILDVVLAGAAYTGMLLLRYEGEIPSGGWRSFTAFVLVAVAVTVGVNAAFGLYGQLWRHASFYEAQRMAVAGATCTSVLFAWTVVERQLPLSTVVAGGIVATFLMGVLRFQSRLFSFRRGTAPTSTAVVVIGAGDAGASLVGEMVRNPRAGFVPVAVLDEDPKRQHRSFGGVSVQGPIDDLPRVAAATGATMAIFAQTNAPQQLVRKAANAAEEASVALKILPGLSSTIGSVASLQDIRDVHIEDLLGRQQIQTDLVAVRSMLQGRCVLITGAGGSIGSEIARQVATCGPRELLLVDHDETHLHDIASDLGASATQVLLDIRNRERVEKIFRACRPDVVFHAAAHKHVPILEAYPCEAAETNVLGTANVIDAAVEVGVQRLVAISTDKAVQPSSVMGASKRISEQLVLQCAPSEGSFCAVRFGNVLGSRGSVVPTFIKQIRNGGPVTVTDERMTRYFMSIEEAVQLVLQAAALADGEIGGEVFLLDMGEPVRIMELAERMIRLSGRRPGSDIAIEITGQRPGEKLDEVLTGIEEEEHLTEHPSIRRMSTALVDSNTMSFGVDELRRLVREGDDSSCAELLRSLATADGLGLSLRPDLELQLPLNLEYQLPSNAGGNGARPGGGGGRRTIRRG